ncbi:Poly(ADP-ribose) glycohydrolase like protein, partial [Aduncisulcus paluster]
YPHKPPRIPSPRIDGTPISPQKPRKERAKVESGKHRPYIRRKNSTTLTSSSTITPQCIIGRGGFGEVLLVKIDGIPFPCVLKKMLEVADEKVIEACQNEFKTQLKLFINPKCSKRIPRPMYILDLLDAEMKGVYGFIMEFCAGGSVDKFARDWCNDSKCDAEESDYDSESSSSYSDSSRDEEESTVDPMSLNPVKVAALCVGMIECLNDVFRAKKSLIHRDIKPDNFLISVDPKDGECTVVLADLGLVQIRDSLSSSCSVSKSFVDSYSCPKERGKRKARKGRTVCGTLAYNSYEALKGNHSDKSDSYSLGLTILALFECHDPFVNMAVFREVTDTVQFMGTLMELIKANNVPKLSESRLFRTLKTIEGGKFRPVYSCLKAVFKGLTKFDIDERMSVHEACEKVQSIKRLLPKIGEGWKCPSIDDIVRSNIKEYGDVITIEDPSEIPEIPFKGKFDSRISGDEEDKKEPKEKERREKERREKERKEKKITQSVPFSICPQAQWDMNIRKIQNIVLRYSRINTDSLCSLVSASQPDIFLEILKVFIKRFPSKSIKSINPEKYFRDAIYAALKSIICLHAMGISEKEMMGLGIKNPIYILSRTACVGLNACAFFGLFSNPKNNVSFFSPQSVVPDLGLDRIPVVEKCACFLQYFHQAYDYWDMLENSCVIVIYKYVATANFEHILNPGKKKKFIRSESQYRPSTVFGRNSPVLHALSQRKSLTFSRKHSRVTKTLIPSKSMLDPEMLKAFNVVDFANKLIGGGIFGSTSCSSPPQEEALMLGSPDLLVARYLCSNSLVDNDAIWVIGAIPVSQCSKYDQPFQCDGVVEPKNSSESTTRHIGVFPYVTCIVDALPYDKHSGNCLTQQIKIKNFTRELAKALAAFLPPSMPFIETMLKCITDADKKSYKPEYLWLPFGAKSCLKLNPSSPLKALDCVSSRAPKDALFQFPISINNVFTKHKKGLLSKISWVPLLGQVPPVSPFEERPSISALLARPILSGLWGCGTSNGDYTVKGIIQMCAIRLVHYIKGIEAEFDEIELKYKPQFQLILSPYHMSIIQENWKSISKDLAGDSVIDVWKNLNEIVSSCSDSKSKINFFDLFHEYYSRGKRLEAKPKKIIEGEKKYPKPRPRTVVVEKDSIFRSPSPRSSEDRSEFEDFCL